jgi:hypothetical protein
VIADKDAKFYGYCTANRYHDKRTESRLCLTCLDNVDRVNDDLEMARGLFLRGMSAVCATFRVFDRHHFRIFQPECVGGGSRAPPT